jgi:hypothetical protein
MTCSPPPSFLYADNSMGRLNQSLSLQERHYGEAIIEIRAIRNISLRFLKKVGIHSKKKGKFLVKAKESLPVHALKLFDFLMAFGTDEDDRDFEVGLSFAVVKHN